MYNQYLSRYKWSSDQHGMNPSHVDLYHTMPLATERVTKNGDFEGPFCTSKLLWLQTESPNILCLLSLHSWCYSMWWMLCSACFWCQNHMWKIKAEFSWFECWPNGLLLTICNFSSYLANHLKNHVIWILCTLISGLVIERCSKGNIIAGSFSVKEETEFHRLARIISDK